MNYELMDYAVAAVLAEKFAKANDKVDSPLGFRTGGIS